MGKNYHSFMVDEARIETRMIDARSSKLFMDLYGSILCAASSIEFRDPLPAYRQAGEILQR